MGLSAATPGFDDEAYFGRFFRKHTERTPTAFREELRARLTPSRGPGRPV